MALEAVCILQEECYMRVISGLKGHKGIFWVMEIVPTYLVWSCDYMGVYNFTEQFKLK